MELNRERPVCPRHGSHFVPGRGPICPKDGSCLSRTPSPPKMFMFIGFFLARLSRVSSRIHILHRFAHGCVSTASEKKVGWAQCVKPWQRDWNSPGMRESAGVGIAQAQGPALHNEQARRFTGYVITTKQRVLLRLSVARSPPAALRGEMPAALHGQCHAMRALRTSKPSMLAAGDFQHFLCYTREEGQPIPCKM